MGVNMAKEYKLPEVLNGLLTKNNMTQSKLALEMNISPFAVHKWLNFKSMPSVFKLMELSDYFNVSIDFLIYGKG